MTTVAIAQDMSDISRAIVKALGHLDLEPLIADRYVAVKLNETWATQDDTTAVTQGDTRSPKRHTATRSRSREHSTASLAVLRSGR